MRTPSVPRFLAATTLACLLATTTVVSFTATAQETATPDETSNPDLLPSGAQPLPASAEAFRSHFNVMLQEHTFLAGATTHALVNNRREEHLTAQSMLQANSVALAREIGALYGPVNEARFLQSWKRHIQDYEMYAEGAMTGSDAQKQQARADLDAYVAEARIFFQELNPAAPIDTLGSALADHVHGTLAVIDAQVANDLPRAFTLGRQGAMMTAQNLADPLAVAIVRQFPERFPGDLDDPNVAFRRQVTLLVHADTMLSGVALGAVVMGRGPEGDAVSSVLEQNTLELSNAIGSHLSAERGEQFTALWKDHHAALMDYARAVPANDVGRRQQAMQRVDAFRMNLAALFAPSSVELSDRFIPHAAYVTSALDALGMHDLGAAKAFQGGASRQSQEIGVRLALAADAAIQPAASAPR